MRENDWDESDDELFELIRQAVNEMYHITEEMSGYGDTFTRAVGKDIPIEFIHHKDKIYNFNLN